jgi:hypothetical protein
VTANTDGSYFRVHTDSGNNEIDATRQLTYVYYFNREPKGFAGGELRIYDDQIRNDKLARTDSLRAPARSKRRQKRTPNNAGVKSLARGVTATATNTLVAFDSMPASAAGAGMLHSGPGLQLRPMHVVYATASFCDTETARILRAMEL